MLEVMANIYLLCTHEGGRTSGISSGYRPHIRFSDHIYIDGAMTFSDRENVFPGEQCQVQIRFPKPEMAKKYLRVGTTFDINEGAHKVGEGTILAMPQPVMSTHQDWPQP